MRTRLGIVVACTGWMLSSCEHSPQPVTGPGCDVSNFDVIVPYLPVYAMDVLLVIDNSPSMAQEQMHLRTEVPHLFDVLRTGLSQAPEHKDEVFFPERFRQWESIRACTASKPYSIRLSQCRAT